MRSMLGPSIYGDLHTNMSFAPKQGNAPVLGEQHLVCDALGSARHLISC